MLLSKDFDNSKYLSWILDIKKLQLLFREPLAFFPVKFSNGGASGRGNVVSTCGKECAKDEYQLFREVDVNWKLFAPKLDYVVGFNAEKRANCETATNILCLMTAAVATTSSPKRLLIQRMWLLFQRFKPAAGCAWNAVKTALSWRTRRTAVACLVAKNIL